MLPLKKSHPVEKLALFGFKFRQAQGRGGMGKEWPVKGSVNENAILD